MARLPTLRESWIRALVSCEFPAPRYDQFDIGNPFGRAIPDDEDADERFARRQEYEVELSALSEDALRLKYEALQNERESKRPFNQPSANADFSYWAMASYWTPDEITALSFGKDPAVANGKLLDGLVGQSPFARSFFSRRELVMRAKTMG
jgi:hypothetical protein